MNEMISRRTFLKVAGLGTVSIAAFGLTGCGGSSSGSSSPTEKVYKKLTDNDMNQVGFDKGTDFDQLTPAQKEKLKQVVPYSNDVYFPLVDVADVPDDDKGTGLSMVTVGFEVMNDSAQPIKFERSVQDFQIAFGTLASKVHDADSLKDAIAEANENYGSKQFASNDAQLVVSYGVIPGDSSDAAKEIPAKQDGIIVAVMLVKQGWTKLNVNFTPNFASGKTFRFEVSRADVDNGDEE